MHSLQPDINWRHDSKQPDSSGGPRQHAPSTDTCPWDQKEAAMKPLRTSLPRARAGRIHLGSAKTEQERDMSPKASRPTDSDYASGQLRPCGHGWGARKGGPRPPWTPLRPPLGRSAHRKITVLVRGVSPANAREGGGLGNGSARRWRRQAGIRHRSERHQIPDAHSNSEAKTMVRRVRDSDRTELRQSPSARNVREQ